MSGGLIVPNDLVGWWCPSLDATGALLLDRSGRNNHGALTNMDPATDWVVNGGKYSLDLDGLNDYIEFSHSASISFASNSAMSIIAWIKLNASSGYRTIITKRVLSQANYELSLNNTSNQFGFFNGSIFTVSSGAVTVGEWSQLACTVSSTSGAYFLNGAASGTFSYGIGAANSGNLFIGREPAAQFFNGQIDDIRIYNRALTAGEVRQLYTLGRGNMPLRRRRRYAVQAAGGVSNPVLFHNHYVNQGFY
jgi:hypothetical protein